MDTRNVFYVDPREIAEILREREAREIESTARMEREARRSAGQDVPTPTTTPEKPRPQRSEPYFQWGRAWAQDREESKAFGIARSRAKRMLGTCYQIDDVSC